MRLACLILIFVVLPSAAAAQDRSFEVALEADRVNQEHCADLYTKEVDQAASATLAVAAAWQEVDVVYRETPAPYLLFWRGVLAQCLGRIEAAVADLEAFVASQEGATMFTDLVRQAKTRLRRIAGGGPKGQGPAAAFLRRAPRLEIEAAYGVGGASSTTSCGDPDAGGVTLNSSCEGQTSPELVQGGTFAPVGLRVRADVFAGRVFGIGLRGDVLWMTPSGGPTPRDPGGVVTLALGPHLRVLNSVASGRRAWWFRLELRAAAAFGTLSPWAGSKFTDMGLLDGGTWALRHVGPAAWLSVGVEVAPKVALDAGAWFAWYVPMPGAAASRVHDGGPTTLDYSKVDGEADPPTGTEEVEVLPDVLRTHRMAGGLRVTLLVPAGDGRVALGPFIGADVHRATMRFPDAEADWWPERIADDGEPDGFLHCNDTQPNGEFGDDLCRKVYSTHRTDVVVRAGIEIRFGAGRAGE